MKDPLLPGMTYRDGTCAERCELCGSALRQAGGDPVVSVLLDDLEEVTCLLVDYVDCPSVWAETIRRFEQAAGRTVAQMKAAERVQQSHDRA